MISIELLGGGECRIVHGDSGTEIRSSKSPAYGGSGGSFSSTDLLAAALGSCIATNLEPVASRHSVPLSAVHIQVQKALGTEPKRVKSLSVDVTLPPSVPDEVCARLSRAADACLVHRSLSPDVDVRISVLVVR